MSLQDWLALGLPCLTIALAVIGTYAGPLGQYLAARTHNERLGRIAAAAGRYAADISVALSKIPPGSSADAMKALLIQGAVSKLRAEFATSVTAIGATDPHLLGIVTGELNKLPPQYTAIAGELVSTLSAIPTDPAPAPPAQLPAPVPDPQAAAQAPAITTTSGASE